MSDEDDDVSADAATMEPELSIEDVRAGKTAPDADDDAEEVSITPGRQRQYSERTRALFAEAAKKIATGADDDDDVVADEPEEPAPKVAAKVDPAPEPKPEDAAPPAPSLDPKVQELRAAYETRAKELEAREAEIAKREKAGDLAKMRARYLEDGSSVIADTVRGWIGKDATDEDFKQEVADLVTDLSVRYLGVSVPDEIKTRMEAKRALRSVKWHKEVLSETEAERETRRAAEAREDQKRAAMSALDREILRKDGEGAGAFPFLAAEDHPGQLVFEICEAQYNKDGTRLDWRDAAKRADDYLRKQAAAYYDKRRHLLTPSEKKAEAQGKAPGDPQGHRRSQATPDRQPTTTTSADGPRGWSREVHRDETKKRHAQRLREAFAGRVVDE